MQCLIRVVSVSSTSECKEISVEVENREFPSAIVGVDGTPGVAGVKYAGRSHLDV